MSSNKWNIKASKFNSVIKKKKKEANLLNLKLKIELLGTNQVFVLEG